MRADFIDVEHGHHGVLFGKFARSGRADALRATSDYRDTTVQFRIDSHDQFLSALFYDDVTQIGQPGCKLRESGDYDDYA